MRVTSVIGQVIGQLPVIKSFDRDPSTPVSCFVLTGTALTTFGMRTEKNKARRGKLA